MAQFRKKPVVIEAVRFVGLDNGKPTFSHDTPPWLSAALGKEPTESGAVYVRKDMASTVQRLIITTLEGEHEASDSDWIIQGVEGEIYPCKPKIFAATYEPVTPWPPLWKSWLCATTNASTASCILTTTRSHRMSCKWSFATSGRLSKKNSGV